MKNNLLKAVYFVLNGLVMAVIVFLDAMEKHYGYPYPLPNGWLQPVLVLLSAVFAIVIPMWLRISAFSAYAKKDISASTEVFFRFELFTIISGWLAFAITPLAYVYAMNMWARYLITFMALYSLYYTYPWQRKLMHDARLFKIKL